jgi:hypothetical protein
MSESESQQSEQSAADAEPSVEGLRDQLTTLQQRLRDMSEAGDARLLQAELKIAALRAGMIDLDGLKLIDSSSVTLNGQGDVEGAAELMSELKQQKPWLFGGASSSSRANPPPAHPPRAKAATEMTPEEYRAARAEMLRRR